MIRDVLLPALQANFADRGFRLDDSPNAIGVFPAAHPDVGDVTIWDDGDEATVGIGEITHGHFNPYDETLSEEQIAERVTSEVVEFLTYLFADQVLLWTTPSHGAGWQVLGQDNDFSLMAADDLTFLWSGPVRNPHA